MAAERVDVAPLTPTQQLLYCFERATPGTAAYRVEHVFRVRGTLDLVMLQAALNRVANRHDSLRAEFSAEVPRGAEGYQFLGVVQRYAASVQVPLAVSDGPPNGPCEGEAAWIDAVLETPIALDSAPLLQAFVRRASADEAVLVLLAHHCVWDGWSAGLFLAELGDAMTAAEAGTPWSPPPAPSFAEHARRSHHERTVQWLEEHLQWWRRRFEGAPSVSALPRDRDYPPRQTYEAGTLWFEVPASTGSTLRRLCSELRATPFMLLSAGFAVFLRRHLGPDVVWGTAFGNRDGEGLERTVGDFATALPLRVDLSADLTFRKILSAVRTAVLETLPHQGTPFHKLVPALQGRSQSQRHPLFQVLMQYDREGPGHRFPLGPLTAEELPIDSRSCTLDLGVRMWEMANDDGFGGRVEFRRDVFDAATVEALVAEYLEVLARVAADPKAKLSALLDLTVG